MRIDLPGNRWHVITLLLLVGNLAFGIAIAALMPPFEGMDETAHFARIQSQAFASQAAPAPPGTDGRVLPSQHISQDVFDYYWRGPMPYQWINAPQLHTSDAGYKGPGSYQTYADFFHGWMTRSSYVAKYRTPLAAGFRPGPEPNWQFQHPALYYVVMAPLVKMLAGQASMPATIFALRVFSYVMALCGFAIGLMATHFHLRQKGVVHADAITALGAAYPLFVPEFSWEFARIGNDSISLLLTGIIWALVLWQLRNPSSKAWIYLGFTLGIGILIKALMIAVAVSVLVFVTLYHWVVVRKRARLEQGFWAAPLKIAGVFFVTCAVPYLGNHQSAANLGVGQFSAAFEHAPFLDLLRHNFSASMYLDGLWRAFQSTLWMFGSWSAVIISFPSAPFVDLLFGAALAGCALFFKRHREPALLLALFLFLPVTFGLMAHILIGVILFGESVTPGCYLHVLAPAFALIYGVGLLECAKKRWVQIVLSIAGSAIALFNFFIVAMYAEIFAGCARPTPAFHSFKIDAGAVLSCSPGAVIENLHVLSFPDIALGGFILAFILFISAGYLMLRQSRYFTALGKTA